jgi:HK97 family phage prohead protease
VSSQILVRAAHSGLELRAVDDGGMPTLFGHFAIFNRWTEIDSWFEGNFLERIAPGAFKKTMRENREQIKVLFQHGRDPQIGSKPLGPIEELREDETGAYYEAPLLDTDYNRELLPALEEELYGASFRFEIMREERNEKPKPSKENPQGLPERTIKELRLFEFGPVTFPAYAEATAGVRSLTDHFVFEAIAAEPARVRELLRAADTQLEPVRDQAPSTTDAGPTTSGQERRDSRDDDQQSLSREDLTQLLEQSYDRHEVDTWTSNTEI